MKMSWIAAAAAFAIGAHAPALADAYPGKPLAIVVPFAAGGTVDNVARQVQDVLRDKFGQTVIIENRGGAGGTIGTATVAKANPDGYTVAMVFDSYATEQHVYPKLPYAQSGLTGVSYMVRSPMVLAVPAESPYRTLQDYVEAAKQGRDVSYASVGPGSSNHLAAELFHQTAGTRGMHIPYKGGGPAITDLMGGHVDSMIASLPLVLPGIQGGKLRALAVTSTERSPALPDTPALAEHYPGLQVYSWVGMIAPAATPSDVLQTLAQKVQATLEDPVVAKRLGERGFEVVAGGPADMDRLYGEESERWGALIRERNIVTQ
ncbi:tripartite tricarboxylate transporter substrate binding protein [Verticiella sediminum]|uniref:Tripartite tricarboxylate transporter substrate binding protein n=1 Tax=Verticiella sediminum TaxID=1247510 RepID=A0A556APL0_9BURK|nr:tripartite tricarboxylate transporter substrate binding protein [Verticiella sediminum]TSH94819.1 tripartite tricarboxylate transporter substrate binding protein [Verticiella sediminum]